MAKLLVAYIHADDQPSKRKTSLTRTEKRMQCRLLYRKIIINMG